MLGYISFDRKSLFVGLALLVILGLFFRNLRKKRLVKARTESAMDFRKIYENLHDEELKDFMLDMWRPDSKIGDGSVADTLRYERSTGNAVSPQRKARKDDQVTLDPEGAFLAVTKLRPCYHEIFDKAGGSQGVKGQETVYFGKFASLFLKRWLAGECDEFLEMRSLLERFQTEGDEVVELLATHGFLEGLVNRLDLRPTQDRQLLIKLGVESRNYINAYNEFHGVPARY